MPKNRILHLSTHHEQCGIGLYQEAFLKELDALNESINDFYPTSPNKIKPMRGKELEDELAKFKKMLQRYDVLHIQHEFGFFRGDGEGLADFISIAKELDKPVIITIHTAPSHVFSGSIPKPPKHPKALVKYFTKALPQTAKTYQYRIKPFRKADLVITLNTNTRNQLLDIVKLKQSQIHQTRIPLELRPKRVKSQALRAKLGAKSKEDVLLGTVGFISDKKGVDEAVVALSLLPKNHKLVILGGTNPTSSHTAHLLEHIEKVIKDHKVQDRVKITGYIDKHAELEKLVSQLDIALYPYDIEYYKLASSAAINDPLNNHVPVIAYPTDSFKEIVKDTPGSISLTEQPTPESLASAVNKLNAKEQLAKAEGYAKKYDISKLAKELNEIYQELATSK